MGERATPKDRAPRPGLQNESTSGDRHAVSGGARGSGPGAGAADPPAPSPGEQLRRARLLGHRPGPWLPGFRRAGLAGGGTIQRDIYIDGRRIPPTGKAGKALLDKARLALLTAGLSPHGSGAFFKEIGQDRERHEFESEEAFLRVFVEQGGEEADRVERERAEEKRSARAEDREAETVRGWTRPLKVNRPAWPDFYKKVVKRGEDIRHIVRNATLKNAIEAERGYQLEQGGEEQANQMMGAIAENMGLTPRDHSFETMMEIYRAAYLNVANLFPGPGAINRVIGLTADRIADIGQGLVESDDFADSEEILQVFEDVQELIRATSEQTERTSKSKTFVEGFEDFTQNVAAYLDARGWELAQTAARSGEEPEDLLQDATPMDVVDAGVTNAEIGRELIDIAANFGFDLPDQPIDSEHMEALIQAEIYFANYTGGKPEELAEVLKNFLSQKAILKA